LLPFGIKIELVQVVILAKAHCQALDRRYSGSG